MKLAPTLLAFCPIFLWAADPAILPNSILPSPTLPTGWAAADIGPVKAPGGASYDATTKTFTLRSGGEVTESDMTFAYQKVKGDFMITARITGQSKDGIGSGLMIRPDNGAEASYLRIGYADPRYGGGVGATIKSSLQSQAKNPGDIGYPAELPYWVRLIRVGHAVSSYQSADGTTWVQQHFGGVRFHPGLPDEVLAGLTVSQHDSNTPVESATFDSVTITTKLDLSYASSWLGQTWASNYYQGHVQMQVTAMCIDRSGAKPVLRMTGQNEALDSSVYDLDGNLLWMYQLEHGGGGSCIASDGGFIYEATGGNDNGLSKLKRIGAHNNAPEPDTGGKDKDTAAAVSMAGTQMTGLAAAAGKVYVAEANSERVIVFDGASMQEVATWATPRPGTLALDGKGGLWVVQRPGTEPSVPFKAKDGDQPEVKGTSLNYRPTGIPFPTGSHARLHYFTLDGKQDAARSIDLSTLPQPCMPTGLAISPKDGRIYLCDVGAGQCVWIFDPATGKQIGSVGKPGGVYKNTVPGRVDAQHLFFPRTVTIDVDGSIYVAMCPREGWVGGNLMRKYDPTGTKVLWERQGLEFNECADADPGTDGVDVFTQINRYQLDFSKKLGQEATFVGITFDPFTYPQDRRNATHGGAVNATVVRTVQGQRLLYYHIWARHGEAIYRFAKGSDIAIPAAEVSNDGVWIDNNANGKKDDGESFGKLPDNAGGGQSWVVDANGDIWAAGWNQVRCWRMQGFTKDGVPQFTSKPTETYPLPAGMTEVSYVMYDAAGDRLFLGGFTKERGKDRHDHGGAIGSTLVGLGGVRAGKTVELWRRDVPYEAGSQGLGGETNSFFTGTYAGNAQGGHLFIAGYSELGIKKSMIWAIDPATGTTVERFRSGPETAGYAGWMDFNNTINVVKRKNGEYLILAEDNGAIKTQLFRWTPKR